MFLVNDGKVIWTYPTGAGYEYDDVWMLSNGNILFTRMQYVAEITPDKKVRLALRLRHSTGTNHTEVHTCQPIGLDKVMFVVNGLPPRTDGRQHQDRRGRGESRTALRRPAVRSQEHSRAIPPRALTPRRELISFPIFSAGNVVEYDKNFNEIWSYPIKSPWAALRLKNGNTLITDEAGQPHARSQSQGRDGLGIQVQRTAGGISVRPSAAKLHPPGQRQHHLHLARRRRQRPAARRSHPGQESRLGAARLARPRRRHRRANPGRSGHSGNSRRIGTLIETFHCSSHITRRHRAVRRRLSGPDSAAGNLNQHEPHGRLGSRRTRAWQGRSLGRADRPSPRTDANSQLAHTQLLEKARKGGNDIYFEGDSITRRWGASDPQYKEMLANWTSNFFGWNAADFGWGADRVENILWRLENGELDGVNPKIIVVLAGINNVGARPGDDAKVADTTQGLKAILDVCREKAPGATVIMTAIFPRNDNMAVVPEINRINDNIAAFADGKKVRYLNVNDKLADKDGKLFDGMMNAGDKLHPTVKGYQVWADALKPIFTELLGPPAQTDHAPPPTGDPSASRGSAAPTPPPAAPSPSGR